MKCVCACVCVFACHGSKALYGCSGMAEEHTMFPYLFAHQPAARTD